MKQYILIAGANGVGKSTLFQALDSLKDMPRINTDEIVRSFGDWRNYADEFKAGKIAVKTIREYFENDISFNQETTLCGKSIIKNIETAKNRGYSIELHYVGVNNVEIAKARVAHRVKNGGHGIAEEDIERRYIQSLKQMQKILNICDMAVFYDNSTSFRRFAIYKNGKPYRILDSIPDWFTKLGI